MKHVITLDETQQAELNQHAICINIRTTPKKLASLVVQGNKWQYFSSDNNKEKKPDCSLVTRVFSYRRRWMECGIFLRNHSDSKSVEYRTKAIDYDSTEGLTDKQIKEIEKVAMRIGVAIDNPEHYRNHKVYNFVNIFSKNHSTTASIETFYSQRKDNGNICLVYQVRNDENKKTIRVVLSEQKQEEHEPTLDTK